MIPLDGRKAIDPWQYGSIASTCLACWIVVTVIPRVLHFVGHRSRCAVGGKPKCSLTTWASCW